MEVEVDGTRLWAPLALSPCSIIFHSANILDYNVPGTCLRKGLFINANQSKKEVTIIKV